MNFQASSSRFELYQNPQLKRKDSSSEEDYDSYSEGMDLGSDFSSDITTFKKSCSTTSPQFYNQANPEPVINIVDTMAPKPVTRAPIYNGWSQCLFDNDLRFL